MLKLEQNNIFTYVKINGIISEIICLAGNMLKFLQTVNADCEFVLIIILYTFILN